MPLIHGKQIRLNTLKEELLLVTGSTATEGQILSYDAGSGGFAWVNNTGGVSSVTAGGGLSGNTTTGDVTLVADVDNNSIFLNGTNQISLGHPTTGDIGFSSVSGATYRFVGNSNHVIVEGDFTVNGTSTFINSTNLAVTDNVIIINSGSTVGFGTAGISVDLGNGSFSDILWHESNGGYWAIDNPDGSGATQTYPILTTASLETGSTAVSIVQGTGTDIDKLTIDVVEENFSNIPNSALQNSSFTVADDNVVTGSTPVSLGGTLNIGLAPDSVKEFHLNATGSLTDGFVLTYDSGTGGFEWVSPSLIANDTYVTGGTASGISDSSNQGTISLTYINDEGGSYTLDYTDTYVTGGTLTGTDLVLHQNDGTTPISIDLSQLDTQDTYVSGVTVTSSSTSSNKDATYSLDYVNEENPYSITIEDRFVTGGTLDTGTGIITLEYNDSNLTGQINLGQLDLNDTFSTGTTNSVAATPSSNTQSTDITGNAGFDDFTVSFTDTFVTGGTLTGNNIVLTRNDSTTIPIDISGADFNDTYVTGGTSTGASLSSNSATIDLTYNQDGGVYSLNYEDTFVTGGTISNGSLTLDLNDGSNAPITGTIVETVVGSSPITASTVNGDVTVGIDYSNLQLAVPTTSDKSRYMSGVLSGGTTGNSSNTEITITTEPINDGYVKVEVNGVGYEVLGDTSGDSYFSSNGCTGAVAIASITAGNTWCWNGANVGFELDSSDRIDFFYNVLQ